MSSPADFHPLPEAFPQAEATYLIKHVLAGDVLEDKSAAPPVSVVNRSIM